MTRLLFSLVPKVLCLLRRICPICRIPKLLVIVSRYDDVAEVLSRPDVFKVPFDIEIARLNDGKSPGTPFILGMDDRVAHDNQARQVMRAFKREDVDAIVKPRSFELANQLIASCKDHRIEAIGGLITAVPLKLCEEYYGLEIDGAPQDFAYASMVVSKQLFGPPPIEQKDGVDEAADYVRDIVDASIRSETKNPKGRDTVLARLMKMHELDISDPMHLSEEKIRAFIMGMVVGFVPTNTIAGGHILEMLLKRRKFKEAAQSAARSGDDDLLRHCLFEAMRFMPLNPGPFRECEADHILAAGTPREKRIRKGERVIASTMSAMFDERQIRNPRTFDPARPASDYMLFGYGMHWCAGVSIAQMQITQTIKALLIQPTLERVHGADGELQVRAIFPDRLCVSFGEVQP